MTAAHPATPAASSSSPTTRLFHPGRVRVLRLGWLFVTALVMSLFLLTLPQQFLLLRDTHLYAAGYADALETLRMSPAFFAAYFIAFDLIGVLAAGVLAVVMFRQSAHDWMALIVPVTVTFLLVYVGAYVVFDLLPAWEMFLGTFNLIGTLLVSLVFPDGRFVPRWTRRLPFVMVPLIILDNLLPAGIQFLVLITTIVLSTGIQIYRYRRVSTPVQRQQTKWVLTGMIAAGLATIIFQFVPHIFPALSNPLIASTTLPAQYSVASLLWMMVSAAIIHTGFIVLPVVLGFSILRFRLWDIDLLMNRSLVYGAVLAVLGLLFLLQFFVAQWALTALLGDSQAGIAVAIAAAVTAFLFGPTQRRIQRFVDREWYGFRFDQGQLQKAQQDTPITHPGSMTGQTLGRFHVLDVVGRGGMGEVYKAVDGEKTVAIKTLPALMAVDAEYRARFEREAELLKTLDHPRIVKVLDSGESDGVCYLAMEFIQGHEVGKLLRQHGPLSVEEARYIISELAEALDYAHQRGLVHRDIKPANVMLRSRRADALSTDTTAPGRALEAVLMDFGVVKIQDARTEITGTGAIGTIDYMAPEQIMAAREVDSRADIYALGVMLYEMLTGERPFKGGPAQVMFAHIQQPAPDPRLVRNTIPGFVAHAVLRAMSKSPEDRFQSVRDLAEALYAGLMPEAAPERELLPSS